MEKDMPPKAKGILRKMYDNSKASLRSFRKFQDTLRKEFPGLVDKKEIKEVKKECKNEESKEVKDDKRRIQEVYERRIKYY